MSGPLFSPDAGKSIPPMFLHGGTPSQNTFTLDGASVPKLSEVKAIRWRASEEVKVFFNSDRKGPPDAFFQEDEGVFSVNRSMKSVHFAANPGDRVTLYFEFE